MDFYKLVYFLISLKKVLVLQPKNCPACNSDNTIHLKRKYVVTSLRLCRSCHLMFRYPKDDSVENREFYQARYQEGFTTSMPAEKELSSLIDNNFAKTPKDFSRYIEVLKALKCLSGMTLLDFGCSWGYGTYQLNRAGYTAIGYEISNQRSEYANSKLGLLIHNKIKEITRTYPDGFDIFFSAHVLEHLSDFKGIFELFDSMLKRGGLFVAFCPNGSLNREELIGKAFHRIWGKKHPMLVDAAFLRYHFAKLGWVSRFASSPFHYETISRWPDGYVTDTDPLVGDELLAVAWKP